MVIDRRFCEKSNDMTRRRYCHTTNSLCEWVEGILVEFQLGSAEPSLFKNKKQLFTDDENARYGRIVMLLNETVDARLIHTFTYCVEHTRKGRKCPYSSVHV